MWRIVVALLCLLLALGVVTAIAAARYSRWRFEHPPRQPVVTVCITCRGKGWVTGQERTLRFEGDAFVDGVPRTEPCSACEGTGVIHR